MSESSCSSARPNKGASFIGFPDDYVVIDIETTGLSSEYDEIIEVSAIKISDNIKVGSFSSLINPNRDISPFITELTGITNKMVQGKPTIAEAIPALHEVIGNNILVGHNVNFDINFLYDRYEKYSTLPLENRFIDTMRISRKLHTDLARHRLADIADYYQIDLTGSHRSMRDCEITNQCFQKMKNDIIMQYEDIDKFKDYFYSKKVYPVVKEGAKQIHTDKVEFDISHPLYGKRVVFTGALDRMIRKVAMQMVADLGGINEDNITLNTNYLIIGNYDYCSTIVDGKSTKQKKAEGYKLKGREIDIISENVFYDLANDC